MSETQVTPDLSQEALRDAIRDEYAHVAADPDKGYHFHTGTDAATRLGYDPGWYATLPQENIASFAGTGNPFLGGSLGAGSTVVDAGSGAGFDALIAGTMVGPSGKVIGVDMTSEMVAKARSGADKMGLPQVEFREGYIEQLPLEDGEADVLISNGVLNLTLNKEGTLREWARALRPGGRLQFGDIVVARPVPQAALDDITLWTG